MREGNGGERSTKQNCVYQLCVHIVCDVFRSGGITNKGDTSANEDNSFRNHIR